MSDATGKALLVAAGAAAGILLSRLGSSHSEPHPRRPDRPHGHSYSGRRHTGSGRHGERQHREHRGRHGGGAAAAAAPAATAHVDSDLVQWWKAAPRTRSATYAALLLQACLSALAVIYAQSLRPPSVLEKDWQSLTALLASSAMVLSMTGAWRHHQAAAAAAAAAAALSGGDGVGGGAAAVAAQGGSAAAAAGGWARRRWVPEALLGAATAAAAAAADRRAAPLQDLNGVWVKSKEASDSMDEACDVMRLGGLVRMAIGLIKGLEIRMDAAGSAGTPPPAGGTFSFSLLSGILWFKVTERYPLDGGEVTWKRRDLRRGQHTGHLERCPETGGVLVRVAWGDPLGGEGTDRFHLASPDVLHVDTCLLVGGRAVRYTCVYRRKGASAQG